VNSTLGHNNYLKPLIYTLCFLVKHLVFLIVRGAIDLIADIEKEKWIQEDWRGCDSITHTYEDVKFGLGVNTLVKPIGN
jgi:hypothetical protein